MRKLCLLILALMLGGCSLFKPADLPTINRYSLNQISDLRLFTQTSTKTLLIANVSANPAYQTNKMVYLIDPHQVNYFTKNKWIDTPAKMLQPLLVQSLRNSGYFHAVVAAPFAGKTNDRLDAHIIQLTQNFMRNPSQVTFSLQIQLVSNATNRVLASRTFTAEVNAPGNNPKSGVQAANQAVSQVLTQVSQFIVSRLSGQRHVHHQRMVELDKPFT